MNNAKSIVHGGLYDFLREAKKRRNPTGTEIKLPSSVRFSQNHSTRSYTNESYQKVAPIIPKEFSFIIQAATFCAVKENSQNDFSAKMQLFTVCNHFIMCSLTKF